MTTEPNCPAQEGSGSRDADDQVLNGSSSDALDEKSGAASTAANGWKGILKSASERGRTTASVAAEGWRRSRLGRRSTIAGATVGIADSADENDAAADGDDGNTLQHVRTLGRLRFRGIDDDEPQYASHAILRLLQLTLIVRDWWFASTAIPLIAATVGPVGLSLLRMLFLGCGMGQAPLMRRQCCWSPRSLLCNPNLVHGWGVMMADLIPIFSRTACKPHVSVRSHHRVAEHGY